MVEKYNRLGRKDLALAVPVGDDNLRGLDLIRIPQLGEGTYTPLFDGNSKPSTHKHIYSRARIGLKAMQGAHAVVNHMHFGRMADSDNFSNDLELKAEKFEDDDDFNIAGIDTGLRDFIADYNRVREQKMQDRARRLGRVIADRSVYVLAVNPADMVNNVLKPDFFVAPTVGMTALRDGNKMSIEPVVEGLSGSKGLMPENFYAMRGLYVPTHI